MARPAALSPEAEPRPALLSPHTPRAIRDALVDKRASVYGSAWISALHRDRMLTSWRGGGPVLVAPAPAGVD